MANIAWLTLMLRTTLSRSVRLQTVPLSFRRHNSTRQGDVVDRIEATPTPAPSTNQEPVPSPRKKPLACDIEKLKAQVQEWTEQAIILLRNRADDFTARSRATFSQLGGQLNKVTGYEEIEALKKGVVEQGTLFFHAQHWQSLTRSRGTYQYCSPSSEGG